MLYSSSHKHAPSKDIQNVTFTIQVTGTSVTVDFKNENRKVFNRQQNRKIQNNKCIQELKRVIFVQCRVLYVHYEHKHIERSPQERNFAERVWQEASDSPD